MAMKQCPVCGEKYSDTYKKCPFCEEEEVLQKGTKLRRNTRGGKRSAQKSPNLLTPMLVILIVIMAALLAYLLFGEKFAKLPSVEKQPENTPVEEVKPEKPEIPEVQEPDESADPENPETTMPEEPVESETPSTTTPAVTTNSEYETAAKLPDGLRLSTTDFTLNGKDDAHTIQVSGSSGTYRWYSKDIGIASVDQSGKVTAVGNGNTAVLVTDGSKKAECIVRVKNVDSSTQTTTPAESGSTSGLKAGAAVVVNGGNGVRVRSGPSTNYEVLATVPNGADIQVVESAGDGWYKITFSNVGGAKTTGYMKGDFLSNK